MILAKKRVLTGNGTKTEKYQGLVLTLMEKKWIPGQSIFYVNGDGQQQRYDTLFIGGQKVRYRELLWAVISPYGLSAEYTTEIVNDSVDVSYKASWHNNGAPNGFYFKEDQDGFSFRNGYDYEGKRLFFENRCNSVETIKDF
jgi:hypothetical protein